jgi:hypothetical protein
MKLLLRPPTLSDLQRVLNAWRVWLFAALIGGALGAFVYFVAPPPYRVQATVVVDFNIEQAWPVGEVSDRNVFYFLEREARKLEELAFSDAVLQPVAAANNLGLNDLRQMLNLSQPADGAWHFYVDDPDSKFAQTVAAAWAESFVSKARAGIDTALQIDAAQKALANNPGDAALQAQISQLQTQSLGITPYIQVSAAQIADAPFARRTPIGSYTLAGAAIAMLLSAAFFLLFESHAQ